jgi:inner membrane protein
VVERLTVEATEVSTRQIQTLTFNDEPPTAQLQQLMLTYSGRQIYLSGTLTVDYPEEIMLPAPGKSLETASLTGETLKLNYHPLNLALVQLANQWVSGHITVQIQ